MEHGIATRVTICAAEQQSEGNFFQTSNFLFIRWFFLSNLISLSYVITI